MEEEEEEDDDDDYDDYYYYYYYEEEDYDDGDDIIRPTTRNYAITWISFSEIHGFEVDIESKLQN